MLRKLRYLRGPEPLHGYDALDDDISAALDGADLKTLDDVREYERKLRRRALVLEEVAGARRDCRSTPAEQAAGQPRDEERDVETMRKLEAGDAPTDLKDWPSDSAMYKTYGEDDQPYGEGQTAKLGPSDLARHADGSISIKGEKVDNPDDYKGEPIPGAAPPTQRASVPQPQTRPASVPQPQTSRARWLGPDRSGSPVATSLRQTSSRPQRGSRGLEVADRSGPEQRQARD